MKKILLGLGAVAVVLIALPLFSAFEAHVINVTAQIENALSVPLKSIDFGTVFPQEHLEKPLGISLSRSFLTENRVDDVDYFIRQKPKCAVTTNNGTVMLDFPTATGHIIVNENGLISIDCGPAPADMPAGATWGVLPSLCEYISKDGSESDGTVTQNDGILKSFHKPFTIDVNNNVVFLDTFGRLTKAGGDILDDWIIDLAVPCFGGSCSQDWLTFARRESGNQTMTQAEADTYTQPIENEHKIFGCDLWVEVKGVSETPIPTPTPTPTPQ